MGNGQSIKHAIRTTLIVDTMCEFHDIPKEFCDEAINMIMENTADKEIDPDEVYRFYLCDGDTRDIIKKVYVELTEQGVPLINIVKADEYPYPELKEDELKREKKGKKGKKPRKSKK